MSIVELFANGVSVNLPDKGIEQKYLTALNTNEETHFIKRRAVYLCTTEASGIR